jgi:hypothetical protein
LLRSKPPPSGSSSLDPEERKKRSSILEEMSYLNDGVYVTFDGNQIGLYTQRDSGWHEIYLEEDTMNILLAYLERKTGWKITIERVNGNDSVESGAV